MAVAPPARRFARLPTEFRVRFPAPLTGASIVPIPTAPPPAPPTPVVAAPAPVEVVVPAPDLTAEFLADRERIEAVLDQLRTAGIESRKDTTARLREWQRAAVELATTIATRLLHDRVVSGEFPVEEKVREMADQMNESGPLTIRLNPADLRLLEDRLGGEPLLPGYDDPRVIPDDTLARAECRVEGKEGMLLSDVTRELNEIRDQLLKDLGHARS